MVTEASKLATAAKKKYYEYEYQYTYGHNSLDCIISHGPLLTRDVDYELTITYKKDRYGHSIGSPIVLPKKIYHY